ncbi:MAG: hypothetical protein PHH01_00340 [Patescibacteria group bacterium]|nr:hypothetical protein [Patescibacteria group bacterium]
MISGCRFKVAMLFAIIFALVLAVNAGASNYVYGSVSMPDRSNDHAYTLGILRAGLCQEDKAHALFFRAEIDGTGVTSVRLTKAYAMKTFVTEFGRTAVAIGQQALPIQSVFPGPQELRLTRNPDANCKFSSNQFGVSATHIVSSFTTTVVSFKDDRHWAAYVAVTDSLAGAPASVKACWERNIGYAAIATWEPMRFFNPAIGASWFDPEQGGRAPYFLQNYVGVSPWARLYAQYDCGDARGSRWLVGATAEYAPKCFLRAYYDTREKHAECSVSFSYSF